MVQINEVVPSRFRAGDLIAIQGFGFSPTFGQNSVAIDGIPEPIASESETEISILVPAGVSTDRYVTIQVFRNDTLDNAFWQSWSSAELNDMRSLAVRAPGQIPGTTEAADPVRVEDVPQAQDYERLMTALEFLLVEVLEDAGDMFGSDGSGLVKIPVVASWGNGLALRTDLTEPAGVDFIAISSFQRVTFGYGKQTASGNTALEEAVPNHDGSIVSALSPAHWSPITGTVRRVAVLAAELTGADTLDQVTIEVAGSQVYDSTTGLGLTQGQVHVASLNQSVTSGQTVELLVKKLGTEGRMIVTGKVGLWE